MVAALGRPPCSYSPEMPADEVSQKMATSPEALVELLSEIAFLTPTEYRAAVERELSARFPVLGLDKPTRPINAVGEASSDITAAEIEGYMERLLDISVRSRAAGDILWGRVQGTKWEREALSWAADTLRSFGIDDVRQDQFGVRRPLWTPTRNELEVIDAPTFDDGETHVFADAVTPFTSAVTPPGGVLGDVIYVGEGTAAELAGRDLTGRIVLLRATGFPGALFNSARVAFSRIATGRFGQPVGVIIWWNTPGALQVAGRVGAVGGGDELGQSLPWISLGNDDGLYLRKLLDRAETDRPVQIQMTVEGSMEGPDEGRTSANVYGIIPGQSGKFIVLMAHADCYFYGMHDNGGTMAMALAVARHYAARPLDERPHGLIVLVVGDHEDPGVGATDHFINANRELIENELLVVIRPEKLGLLRQKDEGFIRARSNVAEPVMLMVTNLSPVLLKILREVIGEYALSVADFVYQDPAADETNFHPPYNDLGAISLGFAQGGIQYHSTADVDEDLVSSSVLESWARAHVGLIDKLAPFTKPDLEVGGVDLPNPDASIYQSDVLKLLFGNC